MKAYFLWLSKLLTLIFVLLIVVPVVFFSIVIGVSKTLISDPEVPEGQDKSKKVAVVEVEGIIMKARETLDELYKQAEDPKVKGIVLRVDSPGGAVGPSQEIYSAITKLKAKKPIVVSMGAVAASGGLYVSVGASKILAQPGTLTGSIGVIMQLPNMTDIASKVGFEMITIKSGALKDVGNSFRKMLPDEHAYLDETARVSHQDFISAVAEGRHIDRNKVVSFADGRIILGVQAKELGLIDGFGDVYDASRLVFELLGEPLKEDEKPFLYYPADKYREFKKILESVANLPALLTPTAKLSYILQ